MSQEISEDYDCDKIAVPLSIMNRQPKVPFRTILIHQIIPTLIGLLFIGVFISGVVYFGIKIFSESEKIKVVKVDDDHEYVIMNIKSFTRDHMPPTKIVVVPVERGKERIFILTPKTQEQCSIIYNYGTYKFYYDKKKFKDGLLLENIEKAE